MTPPPQEPDSTIDKEDAVRTMDSILKGKLKERTLQSRLDQCLRGLGRDTELEFQTGNGPADIYLPARRFIIETKGFRKAGPEQQGSGGTQFDQCQRYVTADHQREHQQIGFDQSAEGADVPWRAALTDGHLWWIWEWKLRSSGDLARQPADPVEQQFGRDDADQAIDWLEGRTEETAGKLWIPSDPTSLFRPFESELKDLYEQLRRDQGTRTKRELWLKMLHGSGATPDESENVDELFILHTLLVTVARAVISTLSDVRLSAEDTMAEGFASWPQARTGTGPTHTPGVEWTRRIFAKADEYDWRQRGRDVLQRLYEELIDRQHREAFGEYYTPDWLTQAIVERVLDEEWLNDSVPLAVKAGDTDGVGILDPACGSGTFLFHASRRILTSEAMRRQKLAPVVQADVVARLVNGIDIHPVAVEISRATLMRALPANPANGVDAVRVFQGDSLLWNERIISDDASTAATQSQFSVEDSEIGTQLVVTSAQATPLRVPVSFATQSTFASDVSRLVETAEGSGQMPVLLSVLDEDELATIKATFENLKSIIAEEGNSVWAWYIINAAAAVATRQRKVNRIVANPPWVRMSKIQSPRDQEPNRRKTLEALAEHLGLWGQGQANSSTDLAGIFLARCSENYLTKDATRLAQAAWVLPAMSITGENWARVRERYWQSQSMIWNLCEVKKPPFSGATSCVWFHTASSRARTASSANDPEIYKLINLESSRNSRKVTQTSSWTEVKELTELTQAPPLLLQARSDYVATFAQGASVVPTNLALVQHQGTPRENEIEITTTPSSDRYWRKHGILTGFIPSYWLHSLIYGQDDLLVFSLRNPCSLVALPLLESMEVDPNRLEVDYWARAETVYARRPKAGKETSHTLWDHFNYQNKLQKQIDAARSSDDLTKSKVVYNSSGQWLRAARCKPDLLCNQKTQYAYLDNEDEACYLTVMLNADCLQTAYQQVLGCGRDFTIKFWKTVPIVKFSPDNALHQELVRLCVDAESAAERTLDEADLEAGQKVLSELIRTSLRDSGVSGQIDAIVRRIMPEYCTT